MFFDLTDDQLALQDAVRQLCRERAPMTALRAAEATGGVDAALWAELAGMGVFSLRVPEADGGAGLGWTDAAVVFEELGRAAVPGPLVAAHLAAGLVDGVVGAVTPRPGQPLLVEHLDVLDALVVVDPAGLRRLDRAEVVGHAVERPLDPLTPLHRVDDLPAGEPLAADPDEWRRGGAVLTAALQVGLAAGVLAQAVDYARERQQFQRPIGSFQAVKHRLADGHVRVEVARSATHAAAVGLAEGGDPADLDRAVSTAKLVAGEAALENAKAAVQVNGAMGFTWELDVHLYLKRAWVLDTHYGSTADHAVAVAAGL